MSVALVRQVERTHKVVRMRHELHVGQQAQALLAPLLEWQAVEPTLSHLTELRPIDYPINNHLYHGESISALHALCSRAAAVSWGASPWRRMCRVPAVKLRSSQSCGPHTCLKPY